MLDDRLHTNIKMEITDIDLGTKIKLKVSLVDDDGYKETRMETITLREASISKLLEVANRMFNLGLRLYTSSWIGSFIGWYRYLRFGGTGDEEFYEKYTIKYKDSDEDLISFSTDKELRSVLNDLLDQNQRTKNNGTAVFKVVVQRK